ncbi:hypothetical protein ES708_22810 [subsurface metagenome]
MHLDVIGQVMVISIPGATSAGLAVGLVKSMSISSAGGAASQRAVTWSSWLFVILPA